jgi:transglutaminase-like putative cysteine protease
VFEIRDSRTVPLGPPDPDAKSFLAAEPFLESDAPEVIAEAAKAVQGVDGTRARAERLVRYVNALLEKKPTVSLPSAREVLRTKVGDCNEHTALYVAMARALGIPARIAVGLVDLHGAFYYHAWPEVYVEERGRGAWMPVDPTLNQFPADVTHLRLARGGLERQALILPMIGRARLRVLDVQVAAGATPVLVGRTASDMRPMDIPLPRRDGGGRGCWSRPAR